MIPRYSALLVIGFVCSISLAQPVQDPNSQPGNIPPIPPGYPGQVPVPPQCPPGKPRERCDNKGLRYPDVASLANKIFYDNTTGARPCDCNAAIQKLQSFSGRPRLLSSCLVDGTNGNTESFSGSGVDLATYLNRFPNLGVRCSGAPCENERLCINQCHVNIPFKGDEGDVVDPVT
ncbi:uncharacterized protein LOC129597714 [Paramacrobiotus metropolitanus]|uniref:uncharacterized protein LOC129597714 n=1 Tax=Paramacrobiotus metropolitanus TaxID=2943436 RepID=UPI00244576BC|nr:uncharacterized protein LOC129597714 [Paramacrobiotus metropolitanus]